MALGTGVAVTASADGGVGVPVVSNSAVARAAITWAVASFPGVGVGMMIK